MSNPITILLAEDDANLGYLISESLQYEGYLVKLAPNGKEAFRLFHEVNPDLILADVMMPELNGFDLLNEIRRGGYDLPIVLITARALPEDKLHGLRLGADDYLIKPFSLEELQLKVGRMLRRKMATNTEQGVLSFGKNKLNTRNRELTVCGVVNKITNKECLLLQVLLANKGNMVSRELLLTQVWGSNDYFAGRSMDVYLTRLRKYLKPDTGVSIVNYHRTGFRLLIEEES